MNVIKKYWDSVYLYILLLVPTLCMCAGSFWTSAKMVGYYAHLAWIKIIVFDGSQIIYFLIALFFIYKNKKDSSYIAEHIPLIKAFIIVILFIQYNFILYLFASNYVWECTFIFFACIAFMFDSKLMCFNIIIYCMALVVAHVIRTEDFFPLEKANIEEIVAYRILIVGLTSFCFVVIVYFGERFLLQAQESDKENVRLLGNQLEYYKEMELMDKEIRKFRHDIKNHFICMEMLVEHGKIDELQEYFKGLHDSYSFDKKIYFSGNDIIDAILYHELSYHCQKEVKVTVCGKLPVIQSVSAIDLCTLFSNLLSNAIAAANQCVTVQDENVGISIRFSSGNKYFAIEMANSVASMTEKKKKRDRNHGYGIGKIQEVLEKYDGRYEQSMEEHIMKIVIYLPV